MKKWYVHLIYLSIIAYLGYNYWSSVQAFKAFEHLDRQLHVDSGTLEESSARLFRNIQKNCDAYKYSYNMRQYDITVTATKAVDSAIAFIIAHKNEFIKLNGGLDTVKYSPLINGNSTKTSKIYFTDAKIIEIKDKLTHLNNIFIDSIQEKWQKEKLMKELRLPELLTENEYWNSIKTIPANAVLAQLSALQNQIQTDEIAFLNYVEYVTSPNDWGFTKFKTAIAPKKAVLIEGETFEADVYIASYSSNPGRNVIIKVNGEPLEIKEGVAHFKSKKQTMGSKTIKAEAIIRNPLTGQLTTTEAAFEYQVLPKCSRDCQ